MIENNVLREMEVNGGKFEKRLADLYFCADSENAKLLETAFSTLFNKWILFHEREMTKLDEEEEAQDAWDMSE